MRRARDGIPPIVNETVHASGHALDEETRQFMEPRFGVDLSGVRLHTDNRAADSARAVQAKAYRVGQDVVFADGQFARRRPGDANCSRTRSRTSLSRISSRLGRAVRHNDDAR